MTEAAADHLAGRRVKPPPPKRRARRAVGHTAVGSSGSGGPCPRADRLRLESRRVDPVGVEALVDGPSLLDEARDGLVVREHDVRGRDGLLLVEPPDVQLVDRFYAWDLHHG